LPTTRHRCNLEVWALAQSRENGHRSLVTPERVLSEYNKDLSKLLRQFRKKFLDNFKPTLTAKLIKT